MKVYSVVLLFGLAVTIAEAGRYDVMRSVSLPNLQNLKAITGLIRQGPGALVKRLGVDLHKVLEMIEFWIKRLEPHLQPTELKRKVKKLAEILTKIPLAIGVAVKTDFLKLADMFEDKIVATAQLALSVAKMIVSALKTLKV